MKHWLSVFFVVFSVFANAQDCSSGSSDSAVISFLEARGIAVTSSNRIKLLKSGKEKFNDLFLSIEKARHSIHLEYFNFRQDSIAGELFSRLAKKAKQGVKVRAVFDAFGNMSNNKPLRSSDLKRIRSEGIEIEPFDPVRFPFVNHIFCRDHRKIIVIDGETAYIGGINIADYYINGLERVGEWRDMHLRVEGDAVNFIQDIFLSIWNRITGQQVGGAEYFRPCGDISGKSVAIVSRTPRKMTEQLRDAYIKSIASARKNIQIVNPYFIPPRSVKKELKKALKRGVKLEIMISARCDIKFTPDGVFDVAHKLMKKGADIYVYNSGFHHSKVMTVDSLFCTVGSTNLDSRSLFFDYEANAFIFDREITDEIGRIFDNDKANSTLLTPDEWKKRSKWRRFVGSIANLLHVFL